MENLELEFKEPLTWTKLPQGLENSPTFLDEALGVDLLTFWQKYPESTLLQDVENLP